MFLNFNNFGFMNYGCGMNYQFGSGIADLFSGVKGLNSIYTVNGGYNSYYGAGGCCSGGSGWPIVGYALGTAATMVGGLITMAKLSSPRKEKPLTKEESMKVSRDNLAEQQKIKKESEAKNNALTEERTTLIAEKSELSTTITALETKIDDLEIELAGITDATEKARKNKEIDKKKTELKDKKAELKTKENRINAIAKEQTELLTKIQDAEDKIEDLAPKVAGYEAELEAERKANALDDGDGSMFNRSLIKKYKIENGSIKYTNYASRNSANEKITKDYTLDDMKDRDWRSLIHDYRKGTDEEKRAIRTFIQGNLSHINNNLKGSLKDALIIINNENV